MCPNCARPRAKDKKKARGGAKRVQEKFCTKGQKGKRGGALTRGKGGGELRGGPKKDVQDAQDGWGKRDPETAQAGRDGGAASAKEGQTSFGECRMLNAEC